MKIGQKYFYIDCNIDKLLLHIATYDDSELHRKRVKAGAYLTEQECQAEIKRREMKKNNGISFITKKN